MKPLAVAVRKYLALRRSLGFQLYHHTWWLPDFASFVERHGGSVITTKLALAWAQQPSDADPSWWAAKLGAVRRFAKHHQAFDPRTEVPAPELLPYRPRRLVPHIYSDEDITALMRQAGCLRDPLRAATYATLIGLLATTGMRVGEAIGLDQHDIDWRQALVTVREGKFKKSRALPVHHTTLAALRAYAQCCERERPHRHVPSVFVSRAGTRLLEQNVWRQFAELRTHAGLVHPSRRLPRIHDLRHTFAVRTLERWYHANVDVERRLPWLSTYLGHVSPSSTYWYLTATPELLALASERAERAWKVRP